VTMLQANGIETHVEVLEPAGALARPASGSAPTVVMIHGMGQDSMASWFFTLGRPLSDAGLRSVMYDLRGHGQTERPATGYRLDDFVDDLEAVLEATGVDGPLYLFGNSFGGTIAFTYTMRHPERVAGIATVESAPPTEGWMSRVVLRMAKVAALKPGHGPDDSGRDIGAAADVDSDSPRGRARPGSTMLASTSLVQDMTSSPVPERSRISDIACPVLCIFAGDSGVSKFQPVVEELLTQARTIVLPGQTHAVLVTQPDMIRELLLTFLDDDCGAGLIQPIANH
jgi:pimeloyl-ACP methyl ester carboxylesterase